MKVIHLYLRSPFLGKPAGREDVNNPDWVPNIHLGYGYKTREKKESSLKRYERSQKRLKHTDLQSRVSVEESDRFTY